MYTYIIVELKNIGHGNIHKYRYNSPTIITL